jgi:hypothetical protein
MKVVWIVLGGILLGGVIGGAFFLMQQKPMTSSVEMAPLEEEPAPTSAPEMVKYQNEAGFSFEHPNDVTVKENELDATSYADLELTSSENPGSITIKIVDTKLKDLPAWKKQNTAAAETAKSEQVALGDLDALDITLNSGKTTLVAVGQSVLYTITVDPENNFEYWQKVYQGVVDSWVFELPDSPTSAPAKNSGGGAPASGGDIYEEETIE